MISTAIISVVAFLSTNIDDIFLLTLLFSTIGIRKYNIYAGHFLGIAILSLVSRFLASGISALLGKYIFLMGIIPIALGVRAIFDKDDGCNSAAGNSIISIFLLTISAGGDNIGIYTPLFADMSNFDFAVTLALFCILSVVWCFIAQKLSSLPALEGFINKYRRIIVPLVFIALGIKILTGPF